MSQLYGIAVIDANAVSEQSDKLGIGITAIVRIKHAALYEAAKALGGASALARHLGITDGQLGEWINLKSCPPKDALSKKMRSWSEEKIAVMEAKLHELTGKTWEELWPDELRENHEFLNAPKSVEKVYNWQQAAMLNYAAATRQRLTHGSDPAEMAEGDSQFAIHKDAVAKSIHLLTERERKVLSLRFGFGCDPHSLSETGKVIGVTQERVRQIEAKAIKRLREFANLSLIASGDALQATP